MTASGSALIVVMMTIVVLCLIAGSLMSYTSAKQSGPFQAASWHEAGAAAEGGVEVALNALRRSVTDDPNAWSGWTADPTYAPSALKYITDTQLLSHEGEGNNFSGNGLVQAIVEITKPVGGAAGTGTATTDTINPTTGSAAISSDSRRAFLIRSTGIAYVPGPARLTTDRNELALRRVNFFNDFRTQKNLIADANGKVHPQVTRVVEAIASPVTPFPAAILSQDVIEIKGGSGMVVDSYDPNQVPYKYDYGKTRGDLTQPGNKRYNGNLATNAKKKDTQDVIRLENVNIYGLAAKGSGLVNIKTSNSSVSGEIIDGFYKSMPMRDPTKILGFTAPETSPSGAMADRPGTHKYAKVVPITCGMGNPGNGQSNTKYYKFSKIHLHKDEILKVSPFNTNGQEGGYAEVWVTGDLIIHNQGLIQVDNGANLILYVGGNITLQEKDASHPAVDNNALKAKVKDASGNLIGSSGIFADPAAFQIYGAVQSHKKKHVKIKTNMAGVVYAPDHEFEVNLKSGSNRAIYGALTGRKFKITGSTQVHYDETLSDAGKPVDYTLETWQEDWYDPAVRTLH